VSENLFSNVKVSSQWLRSPASPQYFVWLSATPSNKRVQGEIYGVRIDVNVDDVEDKKPAEVMTLLLRKFELALVQMESYRVHPPELRNPFKEELE